MTQRAANTLGNIPPTLDMPGQDHVAVGSAIYDTDFVGATGEALIARRIYVGTGGHVSLRSAVSGVTVTYKNVPDGGWVDGFFDRVVTSGTTASDIVAQS